MINTTVIGYFNHGPVRWLLTKKEGTLLTGFDITSLGKIHTLTIEDSEVYDLVLIEK